MKNVKLKEKKRSITIVLMILILFVNLPGKEKKENLDLEKLYWNAKFFDIVEFFKNRDYKALSLKEKLLYIECLGKTGQGSLALDKINPLLCDHPSESEVLATAGIVFLSVGRLVNAKSYIDRSILVDGKLKKALITKVMLLLYFQEYKKAEILYEDIFKKNRQMESRYLFYLIGVELFKARRNPLKLYKLYKNYAKKNKRGNKSYSRNLKLNYKLFKKTGKGELFDIETESDFVSVPFSGKAIDFRENTINLQIKGKTFKVLIDTGNSIGWMLNNRELKELLNPVKGGRILTRIGTVTGILDGYYVYLNSVDFGCFKINNLIGVFVPKPRAHFYDAILNPIFIRDRVVTVDFEKKQFILRTKGKFDRDIASIVLSKGEDICKLPWYGYKKAFVPAYADENIKGLAEIETGAEDIALRLPFARELNTTLNPKIRYLSTGKIRRYHMVSVLISLGKFRFPRNSAEVWPLEKFTNPITGLAPDIIIGPIALYGKYSVSFDPFDKKIVLEKRKI